MAEHKSWKKQHKSLKNHGDGGLERKNFPEMMQHKGDGKITESSGNERTQNAFCGEMTEQKMEKLRKWSTMKDGNYRK